MSWNPFSHVAETEHYSWGRFLRSSLWERMTDSFWAYSGDYSDRNINMGILDYLLLDLPHIFTILFALNLGNVDKLINNYSEDLPSSAFIPGMIANTLQLLISAAFTLALGAVALALNLIKFGTAALLTVVTSPFAILSHLFTWPTRSQLNDDIDKLQVMPVASIAVDQATHTRMINTVAEQDLVTTLQGKSSSEIQSLLISLQLCGGRPILFLYEPEEDSTNEKKLEALIPVIPENQVGISALLRTNMFKTTGMNEQKIEEIEQAAGLTLK